jgi:hypothetical protein
MYWKKKPVPNERERNVIVGHYIIFSDLFCLVMSYEPQTWGSMAEKNCTLCCVHWFYSILFI